jgi:uncharacterized metal-binding protein YceD (DUF177 family)
MTNETLKIFVDQLREGTVHKIDEKLSSDFMDVKEKELSFTKDVYVKGEAYLAENELILNLDISAEALIPCSICNEVFAVPIKLKNLYHAEPLSDIKSGVFNAEQVVRDAVLLDVPPFAECHDGNCPARKEISKFLKSSEPGEDGDRYRPFADL